MYHFNHTNYCLFNINYTSFKKIYSLVSEISLYIKCEGVRTYVCTSVTVGVTSSVANDVIMRTGLRVRDVIMRMMSQ